MSRSISAMWYERSSRSITRVSMRTSSLIVVCVLENEQFTEVFYNLLRHPILNVGGGHAIFMSARPASGDPALYAVGQYAKLVNPHDSIAGLIVML